MQSAISHQSPSPAPPEPLAVSVRQSGNGAIRDDGRILSAPGGLPLSGLAVHSRLGPGRRLASAE